MNKEIILKEATMEDAQILLEWRNDLQTKLASHDQEDIKLGKHLIWVSKVINDPLRQLYIAWQKISKDAIVAIGTCRADYCPKDEVYELSWAVAPEARGKGVGKRMVALLASQLSDKNIIAEVKSDNIGSQKIALYVGMKLNYQDDNDVLHYFRGRFA